MASRCFCPRNYKVEGTYMKKAKDLFTMMCIHLGCNLAIAGKNIIGFAWNQL